MNDSFEEKIVIVLAIIFIIGMFIYYFDNSLDDGQYILNTNDPYNICGEEVYITNNSYGNEMDASTIIEDTLSACGID